jgi:hypothetical protein
MHNPSQVEQEQWLLVKMQVRLGGSGTLEKSKSQVPHKFPSIEGATGKANGLPVFLLLRIVDVRLFPFLPGCI